MGKYDQAVADFNKIIQLDPKDIEAIVQRGKTYRAMGKYDQALIDFNWAIQFHEKRMTWFVDKNTNYSYRTSNLALTDLVEQRGVTYFRMGGYDEALSDFNFYLKHERLSTGDWILFRSYKFINKKIYPSDQVLFFRSLVYKLQGREKLFVKDINQAIQIIRNKISNEPWQIFNLALYELTIGHTEQAAQIYRQGLVADTKINSIKGAIISLDNLMKIFPEITDARMFREMLRVEVDKMQAIEGQERSRNDTG
jgi:tetratricopeptide (TPR) repeat protein